MRDGPVPWDASLRDKAGSGLFFPSANILKQQCSIGRTLGSRKYPACEGFLGTPWEQSMAHDRSHEGKSASRATCGLQRVPSHEIPECGWYRYYGQRPRRQTCGDSSDDGRTPAFQVALSLSDNLHSGWRTGRQLGQSFLVTTHALQPP